MQNNEDLLKLIVKLYCINRMTINGKCIRLDCEENQCLCLDEAELLLLESILDNTSFVRLVSGKKLQIEVEKNVYIDDLKCAEQRHGNLKLIRCKEDEKSGKNYLNEQLRNVIDVVKNEPFKKMLESIFIIQTANGYNRINERKAFEHLCAFGTCTYEFNSRLLIAFICSISEVYRDEVKLKNLASVADLCFEEIAAIGAGDELKSRIRTAKTHAKQYYEKIREKGLTELKIIFETISDFYDNINYDMDKTKKNEIAYLFRIFKNLMSVFGIIVNHPDGRYNFIEERDEKPHRIFDKIDSLICYISTADDEGKLKALSLLNKLLHDYENLSDEKVREIDIFLNAS